MRVQVDLMNMLLGFNDKLSKGTAPAKGKSAERPQKLKYRVMENERNPVFSSVSVSPGRLFGML